MHGDVVAEIASTGTLRAGINTGNFLLVTGTSGAGEPEGVAPDLARAIAGRLGVALALVPFPKASLAGDAAGAGVCGIALIGAEPARAEQVAFTAAYAEIAATYLVPAGSALVRVADVDRPGVRISVCADSAYDLWLTRHIVHADLVRSPGIAESNERFVREKLDVLAGLRPGLLSVLDGLPGARILDGQFTGVQQAVGTARANVAAGRFLATFVEDAKRSGLVAELIARHRVRGLSVAGELPSLPQRPDRRDRGGKPP